MEPLLTRPALPGARTGGNKASDGAASGQGMLLQEAVTGWHRPRPSLAGVGMGVRWSSFIHGWAPRSHGKEGPASPRPARMSGPCLSRRVLRLGQPRGDRGWAGQAGGWMEVEPGGTAGGGGQALKLGRGHTQPYVQDTWVLALGRARSPLPGP